ncbi:hypothetical protein HCN44_009710 [Aphidius gifuensis]|uniref:B3/B4 tRNA-binding domain-containing protein n=1 Tax=Aphidius gifuensis TaxID=684658 RepID=A0A835CWA8_APHGI|nr:leucine-rich repeat-containing protein 47-like [Aphidius gifuensis]KAF7998312.1 hypothetical protein HCN44_009710 [Aphidius gifuensis]
MDHETAWTEVSQAQKENRHELVLSGASISKKILECGLDKNIFHLENINYLNISQTCLDNIPDEIKQLENLTTLVLHSNKLTTIPGCIKSLSKLKVIDCSRNQLVTLPEELSSLSQLTIINFSSNNITHLPCQIKNTKLASLDLSNNKLEVFPDVCYSELVLLAEIKVNANSIKEIPSSISLLSSLKLLDVADNNISTVPGELADCLKLKELNLKGNKLNDRRLYKLVDQCRTKQVLDYVRQNCKKNDNNSSGKNKKGKKNQKTSESDTVTQEIENLTHKVQVLRLADETPVIKLNDIVKNVRPHIVACVIRNLSFNNDTFKKMIQLQNKLHEGICEKRNAATLATHDLDRFVPGDLTYTAMPPRQIMIQPLGRNKCYSAAALFLKLQTEADNLRREKKRNVYSGIHRYLYLIEGKPEYPCVIDGSNQVISLPPITNGDITKISTDTKNIFVEVTSATSHQICRNVLDEFLKELVIQGIGCSVTTDENSKPFSHLHVEQVKVVDLEGNLKHVYPSKNDLPFSDNNIVIVR